MLKRTNILIHSTISVFLVLPYVSPAEVAAPAQASDVTRGGLEEIVVTARKRSESIQDIPASVTAISAEQIAQNDITSLEKLAATSPQLVISRSPADNGAQLVLRGIGSNSASQGIEQSVAIIIDSAYYGQGLGINDSFFDLQRVELLKGPQVLFFGKNATAGVVSVTTANPTRDFEAAARAGYEFTAHETYGEAMASIPLSDTLGVRIAFHGSKMTGGYFQNDASTVTTHAFDVATGALVTEIAPPASRNQPAESKVAGRVTVKWDPTSNLDAIFKATINDDSSGSAGWNAVPIVCPGGFSQLNPNQPCGRHFTIYQNDLPQGYIATFPGAQSNGRLFDKFHSYAFNGEISYTLPIATLTSVLNYQEYQSKRFDDTDFQESPKPGSSIWAYITSTWHAISAEMRGLTSFDGPFNVLAGVYYQNTELVDGPQIAFADVINSAAALSQNTDVGFRKHSGTDGKTISGFTQIIWKIVATLEADAGVRYTHETKNSYFLQPYANPALAGIFIQNKTIFSDQSFSNASPEATLTWKPQQNITIYGAYKTGYKSGGFSNSSILSANTNPLRLSFGPENVKGYEVGIKTTLFDHTLRLNSDAYTYRYTGLQTDYFDGTTLAFFTSNAGAAKSSGVEIEAEWAPVALAGLTIRNSLNYNKAYYVTFIGPCYGGQTPASGCSITSAFGGVSQSLSGKPLLDAPHFTATLGIDYDSNWNSALAWGVSANGRFNGTYEASGFGNPLDRQPSYFMLDAGLRLKSRTHNWEMALLGKNLTNRFVVNGILDGPNTGSGTGTANGVPADQMGFVSLPRTIQLQVSWRH